MRERSCGRRRVLRGLAFCAVFGWRFESASAQPAGRGTPVRRVPTVVIDPGHGGVDPGAISPNGIYEKDIVLATASEFARELAARRDYRVVLTRSTDEFLPLRERVARARAWKADLLLSIHADALPDSEMRGLSVFTQSSQASDREAAALAVSDFAVLTAQDVPSALVELGCLSNPVEERLLQRRTYQQKLARGLVRAVESFSAAHGPA